MTIWNRIRRRVKTAAYRGVLHDYVFTTSKRFDPGRLVNELAAAVESVHSIELEQGRLTVRSKMPCNDVDRKAIRRVMRKHRAEEVAD